ncbi:MAG: CDP-alcohol phosphatidyltransferase family protein [Flavobacteriaceae bacterium]|nr:CDP-alcohol phosphatidyltransferase family protein [Flavobacteriaceae bacterium]MCB0485300.1 CDP-alcohol phosphatidyltransferase family protein [Flavobacteriaceae bacterium]
MKKHIPNIITLLNLFSGTIAVLLAVSDRLVEAALFVMLGIFFDFFDGLAARLLKVQSELGKELDSLADMVTSGVVPGIVMYQLFIKATHKNWSTFENVSVIDLEISKIHFLPFIGLLLTLAAAYRLAKFNLDTRQTTSFIGLPTPAMSLFVLSLPLILLYHSDSWAAGIILNQYSLVFITLLLSYLMNAEIPLFSLKFKHFSLKESWIQIAFLIISIVLLGQFRFVAIPFIILIYIVLSIFKKLMENR